MESKGDFKFHLSSSTNLKEVVKRIKSQNQMLTQPTLLSSSEWDHDLSPSS